MTTRPASPEALQPPGHRLPADLGRIHVWMATETSRGLVRDRIDIVVTVNTRLDTVLRRFFVACRVARMGNVYARVAHARKRVTSPTILVTSTILVELPTGDQRREKLALVVTYRIARCARAGRG